MKLLLPSSFLLGSILATASASATASDATNSKPIIPNKSKNETEASSTASLVDPISPDPVATACAQGTAGACPPCGVGETLLKVLINTDTYSDETSWTVRNLCNVDVEMKVDEEAYDCYPNTPFGHVKCVPNGEYVFTINVRA